MILNGLLESRPKFIAIRSFVRPLFGNAELGWFARRFQCRVCGAISRKQVANECIAQHAGRLWQPVSAIATAAA